MVAKDEQEPSDLLAAISKAGYGVERVDHAYDAISRLHQTDDIGCVISKYDMPRMRGDELALKIKHESNIPVVVIADAEEVVFDKLYQSGVSGIIVKPIQTNAFLRFLQNNNFGSRNNQGNRRKLLRRHNALDQIKVVASNGRETWSAQLIDLSSGGLGLCFAPPQSRYTTIEFHMSYHELQINGYLHCRWSYPEGERIRAGFEFDSTTKQALAKNEAFPAMLAIQ